MINRLFFSQDKYRDLKFGPEAKKLELELLALEARYYGGLSVFT